MKKIFNLFVIIFVLWSCQEKHKKNETTDSDSKSLQSTHTELETLKINNLSNDILSDWIRYYKSLDNKFSLDNFKYSFSDTITFTEGNVFGVFDKEYNKVYDDFIVYSPNHKKYVDFDSYQWSVDENKKAIFSPDQEINLVDVDKKQVMRIGFYGTENWVENAFWDDDSRIIFLENSSKNIPEINVLEIDTKQLKTYIYKDSLKKKSKYSIQRLRKNGIKIE